MLMTTALSLFLYLVTIPSSTELRAYIKRDCCRPPSTNRLVWYYRYGGIPIACEWHMGGVEGDKAGGG